MRAASSIATPPARVRPETYARYLAKVGSNGGGRIAHPILDASPQILRTLAGHRVRYFLIGVYSLLQNASDFASIRLWQRYTYAMCRTAPTKRCASGHVNTAPPSRQRPSVYSSAPCARIDPE